jgi:branched-chain amino acid transport system permease protein
MKILLKSEPASRFFKGVKSGYQGLQAKAQANTPNWFKKYGKFLLFLLIGLLAFFLPRIWGSYNNYVLGLVGLYVILGIGLNIIVGLSGQLMLGFAAFFAMGAYSMALLNAPLPHGIMLGFWPSLLIGILMAVVAAVLLGLPVMGMRGDYLAIVTLGFGEIIRILLKSDLLTSFTGGPRGIQDIRGPTLFGQSFSSDIDYTYIILVVMVLSIFIYKRLERSRTGRAWLAVKEDTKVAQATGVNIMTNKLLALCLGAAFAGLAGGIFAARNQFTGPNDHQLMVSMNILSILIVGGVNSIPGIILGAFTLKGLPEILREIENHRLLVFGGLLVVMMISRPEGLWPATRPNIEKDEGSKFIEDSAPGEGGLND